MVYSRKHNQMIDGLVAGRLQGIPESRIDRHGQSFVVARLKASAGESDSVLVNVIAFDAALGRSLLAMAEGDALSLAGSLNPKVWTDKQGNTRPALDMVAHRILTAQEPLAHSN